MLTFERCWPLDNIEISRSDTSGRTVEAYAAIFDEETEVHDQHGHYREKIHRAAFNRTAKAARALCLYNHGMTLDGKPDVVAQVPLGTPLEIRPDGRGLLTVTRYNRSKLADAVLEAVKAGDIRSQSFRGRVIRSDPMRPPRTRPGQPLPLVTRMELGLSDYGPTPNAYYEGAEILAVRSATLLARELAGLDEAARVELIRALSSTTPPAAGPETTTATPDLGPGAEDPHDDGRQAEGVHSGRLAIRRARIRAEMIMMGVKRA
jgi:HK97 family phage prohead protease